MIPCQVVEAEEVDEDDGGEGDVGGDEEAEENGDGDVGRVARAEGHQEGHHAAALNDGSVCGQ